MRVHLVVSHVNTCIYISAIFFFFLYIVMPHSVAIASLFLRNYCVSVSVLISLRLLLSPTLSTTSPTRSQHFHTLSPPLSLTPLPLSPTRKVLLVVLGLSKTGLGLRKWPFKITIWFAQDLQSSSQMKSVALVNIASIKWNIPLSLTRYSI